MSFGRNPLSSSVGSGVASLRQPSLLALLWGILQRLRGGLDDVPWSVLAAVSNMRPPMKEPLLMELAAQSLV